MSPAKRLRIRQDHDGLATFAQLAERRSFTHAAQRLGVSTSAISQVVRSLERRLGVCSNVRHVKLEYRIRKKVAESGWDQCQTQSIKFSFKALARMCGIPGPDGYLVFLMDNERR